MAYTTTGNLGEAKHGKLKADQWGRALNSMCLQRWPKYGIRQAGVEEDTRVRRQKKLVEATLLLATAIRWATSHRTSAHHASQYMICILLTLTFSKSCTLTWPGVQITMPLSTSDLFFSILAPCMVGGCLCMRGSSDGWERQTPISKSVRSVLCVY